jgi:hypothetical protein
MYLEMPEEVVSDGDAVLQAALDQKRRQVAVVVRLILEYLHVRGVYDVRTQRQRRERAHVSVCRVCVCRVCVCVCVSCVCVWHLDELEQEGGEFVVGKLSEAAHRVLYRGHHKTANLGLSSRSSVL